MRRSISAKSAASTPPAPARIVTTASRWSYSPDSSVRTSSSPRSLRILTRSASASARVSSSSSSAAISTSVSRSSIRPLELLIRSSSACVADSALVIFCAASGSSHRSGADACSESSATFAWSAVGSLTAWMVPRVVRSSRIAEGKSVVATTDQVTGSAPLHDAVPEHPCDHEPRATDDRLERDPVGPRRQHPADERRADDRAQLAPERSVRPVSSRTSTANSSHAVAASGLSRRYSSTAARTVASVSGTPAVPSPGRRRGEVPVVLDRVGRLERQQVGQRQEPLALQVHPGRRHDHGDQQQRDDDEPEREDHDLPVVAPSHDEPVPAAGSSGAPVGVDRGDALGADRELQRHDVAHEARHERQRHPHVDRAATSRPGAGTVLVEHVSVSACAGSSSKPWSRSAMPDRGHRPRRRPRRTRRRRRTSARPRVPRPRRRTSPPRAVRASARGRPAGSAARAPARGTR